VKVGGAVQTSGTTANDFTNPVVYTVTAQDGSPQDYTITVTAALVGLPKTGQTIINTPWDDGYYQKGIAWSSPRFVDNLNGTVTDNLTGLVWEQAPLSIKKTWADALIYCNDLALGPYNDWRLPNVLELESLVNVGESSQATWLTSQGFTNIQTSSYYWSSTSYPPTTNFARLVHMGGGHFSADTVAWTYYVWAVRGGQ
jgi:hypothetical protein